MIGFDPLAASAVFILASASPSPADLCGTQPPAQINVVPRTANVSYDFDSSLKQIQNADVDTVDPYAFHGTTVTQGYMKGSIEPKYSIWLKKITIPKYKAVCVWYDKIEVELNIDPTIVVAKELSRNTCMRNAIIEHELKHVKVDREVVNKYARLMGGKLLDELRSRGFMVGPIPEDRFEEVSAKMKNVVGQILELEFQKMSIERQENQRAVDNLEEYASVNAKCPEFEKIKEKQYIQWLK